MRRILGMDPGPSRAFLLLGCTLGVLCEGLLLFRAESAALEARLREDFRVIVFYREGTAAARRGVVEEKLRALGGVEGVEAIAPSASLRAYAAEDPELERAVEFLGENPLPDAAELRLGDEGLRRLPDLLTEVRALPEVGEAVFKPLQAQALLRLQFHRRMMNLLAALLAGLWAFAAALRLWPWALRRAPVPGVGAALATAAGAVGGGALVLAAAWPARAAGGVEGWPPFALQLLLVGIAGLVGWLLPVPARGGERGRRVVVVALLLGLLPFARAHAADARRRQKELQRIQEQLQRKKEEAREYQRRQQEAQKELSTILGEKQRTQRAWLSLTGRRREASARAQEFSEHLGAIRTTRAIDRRLLVEQVRGYALTLARAEPYYGRTQLWRSSFERAALEGRLRRLGGLRRAEDGASRQRERARSEENALQAKASEAQGQLERQEQLYQARQQEAHEAGRHAAEALAAARELEESARALANLIGDLERRRRAEGGRARTAVLPVPVHSLPWPAEGGVKVRFGKTEVPGLKTWTIHNGIRIAVPAGARVRAVSGGKVIFTGPFRSYGNVLIVDHDEGFFGIYGGLDRTLARKGDRVSARSDIATASGEDEGLYFEVRQGQVPLDPLALLESR